MLSEREAHWVVFIGVRVREAWRGHRATAAVDVPGNDSRPRHIDPPYLSTLATAGRDILQGCLHCTRRLCRSPCDREWGEGKWGGCLVTHKYIYILIGPCAKMVALPCPEFLSLYPLTNERSIWAKLHPSIHLRSFKGRCQGLNLDECMPGEQQPLSFICHCQSWSWEEAKGASLNPQSYVYFLGSKAH